MSWDKSLNTMKEMLKDRGYEYWEPVPTEQQIYLCGRDRDDISVIVYLCYKDKLNIECVKYTIYQLQQRQLKHAIIIYQNIITSSAKKAIEHLNDYTIEMFEKKETQYNPTQHRLYSPHIKIAKEHISSELPTIQLQHLPIILRTDVISRYFHFNRGDVIKINRQNGSIVYRIVK